MRRSEIALHACVFGPHPPGLLGGGLHARVMREQTPQSKPQEVESCSVRKESRGAMWPAMVAGHGGPPLLPRASHLLALVR